MKKSEIYGIIGSVIITGLLILLLFLIVLPSQKTPEEEGIMVSFGETLDGGGIDETPLEEAAQASSLPQTAASANKASEEDLLAQDDNSVTIPKEDDKKKKEQDALEKKKLDDARKATEKKRLEQEALENKKLAEARIAAEKKRKEQEAIDKANMDGLFGNTGTSGTGTTSGSGTQGNPLGSGTSGGNSWSLSGRSLVGKLSTPKYENDVEGKVTVKIRVDKSGFVISASIGTPTTISDAETQKAAMTAAKSTKFSSGESDALGTITYNFKLR